MKSNWFDRLILVPLLTLPPIVLDPFTLYCWAVRESEADESAWVDVETTDAGEPR